VVPMDKVVVAVAQGLATIAAEFRCWLAATFLVFLKLVRTAKSTDVPHFNFLASFDHGVEGEARTGSRFRTG
jgi:hypothetical protein